MDDFIVLTEQEILQLKFIHGAGISLGLMLANPNIKNEEILSIVNKNFNDLMDKFRNRNLGEYKPKIY